MLTPIKKSFGLAMAEPSETASNLRITRAKIVVKALPAENRCHLPKFRRSSADRSGNAYCHPEFRDLWCSALGGGTIWTTA